MRLLLFGACCAGLLYGLLRPESPPQLFDESDKVLHLLAFACLALTARQAFQRLPGWLLWLPLLALAPLLEWLQHSLQPLRQFSELDIAANQLGVMLAWLGWRGSQAVRRRLAPSP